MKTFSAIWSEELKRAILDAAPQSGYTMDLVGDDAKLVQDIVNQGIDGHLEACFIEERGDKYAWIREPGIRGLVRGPSLVCQISPQSLAVLVRRLMDSENELGPDMASAICSTLDIELI